MNDELTNSREQGLIRQHLTSNRMMQVATLSQTGRPWLFTCWYAIASDLSLVFMSKIERRHSKDILADANVAATIVNLPPPTGLGAKVAAVTVEGRATLVGADAFAELYEVYRSRWPNVVTEAPNLNPHDGADRLWTITPENFVLFDSINFEQDVRREVSSW